MDAGCRGGYLQSLAAAGTRRSTEFGARPSFPISVVGAIMGMRVPLPTGSAIARPAQRANVRNNGPHPVADVLFSVGIARAPARAIQELAGHRDLSTTQRYVHLRREDRRSEE
jgi:hypothetical protein